MLFFLAPTFIKTQNFPYIFKLNILIINVVQIFMSSSPLKPQWISRAKPVYRLQQYSQKENNSLKPKKMQESNWTRRFILDQQLTSTFLKLRALSTSSTVKVVLLECRIHLIASFKNKRHPVALKSQNTKRKQLY